MCEILEEISLNLMIEEIKESLIKNGFKPKTKILPSQKKFCRRKKNPRSKKIILN